MNVEPLHNIRLSKLIGLVLQNPKQTSNNGMEGNSRDRYMQIANSSFHSHAHGRIQSGAHQNISWN